MHSAYSQLCAEHFNLLRLLQAMEAEIACYEAGERREGRLSVILDIIDYVLVYPEYWHHPVEEAAFDVLLRREVENSSAIWGVRAEHHTLTQLAHRISELFTAVANDTIVPVAELAENARNYISRQLDHINRENRVVYPLLEKHLSDQDWDQIVEQLNDQLDPLFKNKIKKEYDSLYISILRSSRKDASGKIDFAKACG